MASDLNSTRYLLKGETAFFSGYLVEEKRMKDCVDAIQELEIARKLYNTEVKYRDEKEKNMQLQAQLELQAVQKEAAAVEKGLKQELAKKSAFYRQPWFVAGATAVIFLVTGHFLP